MLRMVTLACAIAFLPVKSVVAQAFWAEKPVQCGTLESALNITLEKEMVPILAGMGWANSANYADPIPVKIGLYLNPESQEFAVLEIDVDMEEACIVAYGEGVQATQTGINNFLYGDMTAN